MIACGIAIRLYLIYKLPLWHDEAFSIYAAKRSWVNIFTGNADPVHLPGYYLFLKIWLFFSNHLFWARISSLLVFIINSFLLFKIGSKAKNRSFGLILIFLYVFSGYFIIFDWQIRMYAGVITLILLSLWFLKNKNWYLFALANTIGLFYDYSFWWYFFPILIFAAYQVLRHKLYNLPKTRYWTKILSFLSISFLLILIWLPFFIVHLKTGLAGITWINRHSHPLFLTSFFFGSHQNYFLVPIFIAIAGLGLHLFFKTKKELMLSIILFSSGLAFISCLIITFLFSPVFHLRSLQICSLGLLFLIAIAIHWFWQKKHYYLVLIFSAIITINFFFTASLLFTNPGFLLIQFFPWKNVLLNIENPPKEILFRETKKLPTPLLIWGLKYTLDGKESLFSKPIPYKRISFISPAKKESCYLLSNSILEIYACD